MMDKLFYFLRSYVISRSVFVFFQPTYHGLLALAGAILYNFPSRGLVVVGVTGTNGKSTVVEVLHQLFTGAGYKTASLSSVRFKIGEEEVENRFKMTMPGRFFVQQFLARARKAGVTHVILEVTSEGIKQFRHKHINFYAAVLTNLTPEHIEAHGGFENYKRAKGELFRALDGKGISVVNLADKNADYFLSFPASRRVGYALDLRFPPLLKLRRAGTNHDSRIEKEITPSNYEITDKGITMRFSEGWEVFAPLMGKFNAENMLASITVAEELGISHETMRKVFPEFRGVPGRMEEIRGGGIRVIIDYAFTPNALRQVYETLADSRWQIADGKRRLICVLGAAGGGRDKWKRPELGKIAGEYCNHVIITNEDPYDENPRTIMEDVARGATLGDAPYEIIEDRRLAIRSAIADAKSGDAVIVTGKGCESAIAVAGGKRIPWDERKVVREELEKHEAV